MGVHFIVHERLGVSLRRASAKRSPTEVRRVTFVRTRVVFASMVATTPHQPWISESEVRARRRRNLMDDNPASG